MVRARTGRRLTLLLAVYLLLTGMVGARLVSVQVLAAADYRSLAERQSQRHLELPATRGKLYDRGGHALAMSLAASTVYADPRVLRDHDVDAHQLADQLAPLLDRPAQEVAALLDRATGFTYLGRQLPRQVGEQVEAMDVPGIGVLDEPTRTYPAGGLAAQLVGFAGVDNVGLSGLESHYDELLAGRPGALRLEQAPGGLTISAAPRQVEPAVAGTDLVLTIDRQVQHVAERELAAAVEEHDAKGGSAVVLDVASGEVLAMASVPGFVPEDIGTADAYQRSNRVLTDVYEPGSVSKIVTAAAALEEDVVAPDDVFSVPDRYDIGSKQFRDSVRHDPWRITLSEIIARSSNVGTIQVAERLGDERLHGYLEAFGYGQPTDLGFPGEATGRVPPLDEWWTTSLPTIAIGQGVSTTLLQVTAVLETIASGGEWVQPSIVRGTVGADGRLRPADPPQRRPVVSPSTARSVTGMLVDAVEGEQATGSQAAVPGYRVAGKTGTAQKPSRTSRGYKPGAYIASFAGFAPAEDPAVVVAVMLDEPTEEFYGGLTAAPVFREITEFVLSHRRVPPDHDPGRSVVHAAERTAAP